ncbi:MAG: amino acid adenylation domain-containing protein [Chloroflexia bacterium]
MTNDSTQQSLSVSIPQVKREEGVPLSFAQQRLWFLDQLTHRGAIYNVPSAIRIKGNLDVRALEMSLSEIVRRHETLRTVFHPRDGLPPIQLIQPPQPVRLPILDLRTSPPNLEEQAQEVQRAHQVQSLLSQEAGQPFDLALGPPVRFNLIRVHDEEYVFQVTMHHIVTDGWSMGIFFTELSALYQAFSQAANNKAAPLPSALPELEIQYADYAQWQREWLSGEVLAKQLDYWRGQLAGAPPLLQLPTTHPRPPSQSFNQAYLKFSIGGDLCRALGVSGERQNTNLNVALLAGYFALLYRYSGQQSVIVGVTFPYRHHTGTTQIFGPFANTLPIRGALYDDLTLGDLLAQVSYATKQAAAHQDITTAQIIEAAQPPLDLSHEPLFQTTMFMEDDPQAVLDLGALEAEPLDVTNGASQYDLTVTLQRSGDELVGQFSYNTSLFSAAFINQMARHFLLILHSLAHNGQQKLGDITLLTHDEYIRSLPPANKMLRDYPVEDPVSHLFEAQVRATPDSKAVIYEDVELTYRELNARANAIAHQLRLLGVAPETLVAVLGHRELNLFVAFLAILKAGGAYLPLDPAHPISRHKQILMHSGARLVLAYRDFIPTMKDICGEWDEGTPPKLVCLEDLFALGGPAADLPVRTVASHLACVMYTSGSTGLPKGVMIQHGGVVNHTYAKLEQIGFTRNDILAQTASQCFAISVWQFFGPLIVGGSVRIFPDSVVHDPGRLLKQTEETGVSLLQIVPSMLRAVLSVAETMGTKRPQLKHLRWLLCTGEALAFDLCRRWLSLYPDIPILNSYGATECTDDVSHYVVDSASSARGSSLPIGRPLPNIQMYVLNQRLQLAPAEVYGDLYAGGIGVGRGYLNDPVETAQVFVPNPFSSCEGDRLYRLGDIARYRADGTFEYIGRRDGLVKINGLRVELGEIEATLRQHPDVLEAVVVMTPMGSHDSQLIAYIVRDGDNSGNIELIREFVRERLPTYMVPSTFMSLDTLPLTSNGKIDRQALPLVIGIQAQDRRYAEPGTELEMILGSLWRAVLGLRELSIHDSFFEVGGDSIKAMILINKIQEQLNITLDITALFDKPTISQLAGYLQPRFPYLPSQSTLKPGEREEGDL